MESLAGELEGSPKEDPIVLLGGFSANISNMVLPRILQPAVGQPPQAWETIKLKKEFYRMWLAHVTLEVADRQVKQTAALA